MSKIELIDTTMRDGNQSLWGATGLTNAMVREIAPVVDSVGFHAVDFVTSTILGTTVRYHKENPWERIRDFHAGAPRTKLSFLTSGLRFISWETASVGLMRLAMSVLVRNGISRFQVMDPMNNMESILAMSKLAREVGAEEVVAGITYTLSESHDDAYYGRCAKHLHDAEVVDRVYLKDPGGLLSPDRVKTLIPVLGAEIGKLPLELHSHCNLGMAPFSYHEAANRGVQALHVAVAPVANGGSQPSAERMVANLRALGHTVDIDDGALAQMSEYFLLLARAENLPLGQVQEFDAAALQHQVPGGVLGTTKRQLGEINQLHKFQAVIDEVGVVRKELGYPIMVTPFSQLVVGQAVMNVTSGNRYQNVPDEVIRYVLGKFGSPPFPIDGNVHDRIMSLPRTRDLAAEAAMPDVPELRKRLGSSLSDEELVLRAVLPAEQVDAMLAASPARRSYNPKARPLIRLVTELAGHRDLGHVMVKKPGFSLTMNSFADTKEGASNE